MRQRSIRQILRLERPSQDFDKNCDKCSHDYESYFCTICSRRFCADHIDSSGHVCGTSGLTKKQLKHVADERRWGPSEKELKAQEFGRKMAEGRQTKKKKR